jgi:hypothetical protein
MRAPPPGARGAPCPAIAVRHLPLHACALDGAAFVLPAAGGAAAAARLDGGVAGYGREDAAAPGPGARSQARQRRPCAAGPCLRGCGRPCVRMGCSARRVRHRLHSV